MKNLIQNTFSKAKREGYQKLEDEEEKSKSNPPPSDKKEEKQQQQQPPTPQTKTSTPKP